LVANLLDVQALSRPLRMRILEHAEGNPFYVEEVIRSLIDSGVIVYDEAMEQWEATRRVEDIAIPDTLQGVLMARIDRLQEHARRVLQMASVIGRIFLYRVLAAIVQEQWKLDARLLTLQREEMIRERARVPELEYIFKHHLTQQAAYNGLLRRERRLLHRQVAEARERLFPARMEEQLGLLAHHWEQAGERRRAVEYLRRAGEQAAAQYANAEAVGYFSRALDLTSQEELSSRYDLLLAREAVHDLQASRAAQLEDLAVLETLAEMMGDDRKRAEVALCRAHFGMQTSDYAMVMAAAREAIKLARRAHDIGREAMGHVQLGRGLYDYGSLEEARTSLEQAVNLARSIEVSAKGADVSDAEQMAESQRRLEAECLVELGFACQFQRDYEGCVLYETEGLAICREIGDRRNEAWALYILACTVLLWGDNDKGKGYCEQALRIQREIGDRHGESLSLRLLGLRLHMLGIHSTAKSYYEESLQLHSVTGHRRTEAGTLRAMGLLLRDVGSATDALEHCQAALRIVRDTNDRSGQASALTGLGSVLSTLGQLDEARKAYRDALALRRELSQHWEVSVVLAGLAHVAMAEGETEQALAHVEEILVYLETHTLECVAQPMEVYLACYRVLRANADPRADEVLEEGYHFLQARAAKISDEEERRSFLENVAANRELVEEWTRGRSLPCGQVDE